MSGTIADLRAKVSVDGAEKAKSDLKGVGDSANTAKGKLSDMGGGLSALKQGFAAGLGAVTGWVAGFLTIQTASDALGFLKDQLGDVLQAGMDQQKVQAQTAVVIKSTGGAAHISAAQVGELSDSMAQMSGVSDDTVQSMVNILLTFTNLKGNIPQVTQTVLDVSTAMHEDLQSAAVQVGKALNDPATGMSALQRIGVTFTQSQKDAAKQMQATGNMAGAQSIVLKELTKEFGGSAQAAGQTFPGMLARLNVSFDQVKEKIGLAVLPILQTLMEKYLMPAADWFGTFLPRAITILTTVLNTQFVPAVNAVMNSPVVTTLEGWVTTIADKVSPALGDTGLAGHANTAKTAIKNLDSQAATTTDHMAGPYVAKIQTAINKVDDMTTSLGGTTATGSGLNPAIIRVNANLDNMDSKLNANAAATKQAQQPVEFLGGIFDSLGNHAKDAGEHIGSAVSGISSRFNEALPNIKKILASLGDDFSLFGDGVHNIFDGLGAFLSAPFRAGFDVLAGVFNVGLDLINNNLGKAGDDAKMALHNIWNDVQDWGAGLGRIIIGIGESVLGWILAPFKASWKQAEGELNSFKDNMSKWWTKTLLPAIEGAITSAMSDLQSFINDHMPHFPGITIPGISGLPGRAGGGPISGNFIGAEGGGPELLVTPGVYHAPPGSYVYTAAQTQQMLAPQPRATQASPSDPWNNRPINITVNTPEGAQIAQHVAHQLKMEMVLRG